MTLLLDNRKGEMSPLVHTRMLYVRDHARQNVEQILYFSRLGAAHKDYYFEPLPILGTCREAVEDNLSLLEEAGFSVIYTNFFALCHRARYAQRLDTCRNLLQLLTANLLKRRARSIPIQRIDHHLTRRYLLHDAQPRRNLLLGGIILPLALIFAP